MFDQFHGSRAGLKELKAYGLTDDNQLALTEHCVERMIEVYSRTLHKQGEVPLANLLIKTGTAARQFLKAEQLESQIAEKQLCSSFGALVVALARENYPELNIELEQGSMIKKPNGRNIVQWFVKMDTKNEPLNPVGTSIKFHEPKPIASFFNNNGNVLVPAYSGLSKEYKLDDYINGQFRFGVEQLQKVPLKINKVMLAVMERKILNIPQRPSDYLSPAEFEVLSNGYIDQQLVDRNDRSRGYDSDIGKHNQLYRAMNAAREIDERTFYHLWFLDWRGRCNILHPTLSYQSHDDIRSLYQFAEGKLLGKSGRKELLIHAANCYAQTYSVEDLPSWVNGDYTSDGQLTVSVDKMSFDDRIAWSVKHKHLIDRVANKYELVSDADKPASFLSACIELQNAFSNQGYESTLPVPIDATASAYQHYGAISKDNDLCSLVGLCEQGSPKDIYSMLAQIMLEDTHVSQMGLSISEVRKTASKPSFMIFGYSGGPQTIANTIFGKLRKSGLTTRQNLNTSSAMSLQVSAAKAREVMCPQASHVRNFLQACAAVEIGVGEWFYPDGSSALPDRKLLSQLDIDDPSYDILSDRLKTAEWKTTMGNGSSELFWMSPSDFPVIFRKYTSYDSDWKLRLSMDSKGQQYHLSYRIETKKPLRHEYQTGIAPNFIHSQDAALVHNTSMEFEGHVIPIHDSFSTHAGNVGGLRQVLLDQMKTMYDYSNVSDEIRSRILSGNLDQVELLANGDWKITDLDNALYAFA